MTLLQEFDGKPKAEDTTKDMQGPTIVMCMAKELRNCIITRTFRVSPTKGFLDNPPPYPPSKVCETIICNVCVIYKCVKLYKCSDIGY